jgi:hypothetical protein
MEIVYSNSQNLIIGEHALKKHIYYGVVYSISQNHIICEHALKKGSIDEFHCFGS